MLRKSNSLFPFTVFSYRQLFILLMNRIFKYLIVLGFVGFASGIVLLTYRPFLGIDDAYIYFVYAKNLVNGHGFVYNIGGERVEGFTSMLWVLICSAFYKLFTESYFRQALMVLNILMVSFALFRLVDFIDRRYFGRNKIVPSLASLCILCVLFVVKGYLDWTVLSLLETGLWSSCLIITILHLLELCYAPPPKSESIRFGLLLSILVLTRPESLLLAAVFLTIRFLVLLQKKRNFLSALKPSIFPTILFAASFAGLILFRLKYFGYPFPNTYYAKVSSDTLGNIKEGITYFFKFFYVYPVYWACFIMLLASLWVRIKLIFKGWQQFITFNDDDLAQTIVVLISCVAFLLPMMVGGDHFSLFRIYQPFVPVFLMLLVNKNFIQKNLFDWQILKIPGNQIPGSVWLILFVPVIYLMNTPKYFVGERIPYKASLLSDFSFPYTYRQVSVKLNHFFDFTPKPSIGRIWAGAYAFGYDGPTIDLLGLNSTIMAHASQIKIGLKNHASFNKTAFYKLQPDFVEGHFLDAAEQLNFQVPDNRPDFEKRFEYGVLKGIHHDSAFIQLYQPVLISRSGTEGSFFTYARVDYIPFLREKGYKVEIFERKPIIQHVTLTNQAVQENF